MKRLIILLVCCPFIQTAGAQSLVQSRTPNTITINFNAGAWLSRSPVAFATNDNQYAYTKLSVGQHPLFTDHYGFDIPVGARIDKIVTTVRKFKSGKNEVKDYPGITWMTKGCCNYGPAMTDPNPWKTTETEVIYQQAGSGMDGRGNSYTWQPEDINNDLFGFTFNPTIDRKGSGAALYIDEIKITVFYTPTSAAATQKAGITHSATDVTMLPEPREVVVYPNPANEKVTLAYSATQSATTIISIYNMQGGLLRTYNSGKVIQGLLYQQLIDLSDLPAGRYMYQLTNGNKVKKGIIVKGG